MKSYVARTQKSADGNYGTGWQLFTRPRPTRPADWAAEPYAPALLHRLDGFLCYSYFVRIKKTASVAAQDSIDLLAVCLPAGTDHQQDTHSCALLQYCRDRYRWKCYNLLCQLARPAALPTAGPRHDRRLVDSTCAVRCAALHMVCTRADQQPTPHQRVNYAAGRCIVLQCLQQPAVRRSV